MRKCWKSRRTPAGASPSPAIPTPGSTASTQGGWGQRKTKKGPPHPPHQWCRSLPWRPPQPDTSHKTGGGEGRTRHRGKWGVFCWVNLVRPCHGRRLGGVRPCTPTEPCSRPDKFLAASPAAEALPPRDAACFCHPATSAPRSWHPSARHARHGQQSWVV